VYREYSCSGSGYLGLVSLETRRIIDSSRVMGFVMLREKPASRPAIPAISLKIAWDGDEQ
jgi:hypothetical protein